MNNEPIYIENATDEDSGLWFEGPGWYWPDETSALTGPYPSKKEAKYQQQLYCDMKLKEIEWQEADIPIDEEMLKEAKAWGCKTIEEYLDMMKKAYDEA